MRLTYEKSVGVARQYCGNLGKVENSQCLVVGALSAENYYTPVDEELFLPEVWSKDLLRSSKAGVPKKRQELGHQTKPELALEIIKRQRDLGVPFDYVAGDALYGNDTEFLKNIDELGIVFMMDVHKNQTIYLEKPRFEEYQVRGWLALHHHLSLCVLIQLYILKEKRLFKDKIPELSAYDLRQIMIVTHATKHTENPDIVFDQMYERHQKRAYDKARYYQNE